MKRLIIFLLILPSAIWTSLAQQTKEVTVSATACYEETLQNPFDDKGLEVRLRICFDEEDDRIDLVLVGSRTMIVFRQDVRYRDVFGCLRNMKPQKLPFPVLVPPGSVFHLDRKVWKGFSRRRKDHLFNRWLENIRGGLTPVAPATGGIRSAEAMMVTDSIVQRFEVDRDATDVSFSLRNLMVADVGRVHPRSKKVRYDIVEDEDMNTSYRITLQRNPCFHTGPLLDSLLDRIASLDMSYRRLLSACPDGKAGSVQEEAIFRQHRLYLMSRYPVTDTVHACPDVKAALERYNSLRDSLAGAVCVYDPDESRKQKERQGKVLNSEVLVNTAHSLDLLVSKILLTKDTRERLDLIEMGDELIRSVDDSLAEREVVGDNVELARKLFAKAKSYFYYNTGQ